jgi:hypothetical protein
MSAKKKIKEICGLVCTFNWRIIYITCLFHTSLWRMLTNFYSGVSSLTRVLFECYISLILTSSLQLWTHPLRTFAILRTLLGDHISVIFYIWMHFHVKRKLYIVSRPFLNLNELIHWCWLSFHYPVQCHRLISWMSLPLLFSVSVNSLCLWTQKSHIISMLIWTPLIFKDWVYCLLEDISVRNVASHFSTVQASYWRHYKDTN